MKSFMFKRILSVLLSLVLMLGALPSVFAQDSGVLKPDFPALVETASEDRVPGVIVTSDAVFYAMSIYKFNGRYAPYRDASTGLYGVIDDTGRICWKPQNPNIDVLEVLANGIVAAMVIDKSNEAASGWRFYTMNGKQINPDKTFASMYSETYDWGTGQKIYVIAETHSAENPEYIGGILMDAQGRCISAQNIRRVFNGILPCQKNGKWGLCDMTGKTLLPYNYDALEFVNANTLLAKQNGVYFLVDRSGKTLKELTGVSEANTMSSVTNRAAICKNGLWGLCDADGKQTVECKYSSLDSAYYGQGESEIVKYYHGKLGNHWYVFSDDGVTNIDCGNEAYNSAEKLAEGIWAVRDGESVRIVDDQDKALVSGSWNVSLFQNGYLALGKESGQAGKYNIVCFDKQLQELFQLNEVRLFGFTNSAFCCEQNGVVCFYSLADKSLLNSYNDAGIADRDNFGAVLCSDNQYALTDASGNLLTDFDYERGNCVGEGIYRLRKNAEYTLFDARGRVLLNSIDAIEPFLEQATYTSYSAVNKYGFMKYREADDPFFTDVKKGSWYTEGTDFCAMTGLMNGMGGGTFAPQSDMTRAMLVRVLYNLSGSPAETYGFQDVPEGKWYTNAVNWAAANGIVNGMSSSSFAPNLPVTREQMVTILYRYAQKFGEASGGESALSGFADADEVSAFARSAMCWAVENGIINGVSATQLSPKSTATRAQVATILMRFVKLLAKAEEN